MDNFQSIIIHWKFAVVLCMLVLGSETVGRTADLTLAKKRKKNEFYTQLVDIENELKHYRDHIKPWSKGGKTKPENLQMLCADCNARKSDKF